MAISFEEVYKYQIDAIMILPYRSYHFFIWRILGAVIPIAFVLAIIVRPEPTHKTQYPDTDLKASLVQQSDSTSTIEVIMSGSVALPSCIARQITTDTTFLGAINHRGKYVFVIPRTNEISTIELYNPIQNIVIKSFSMSANGIPSNR